MKQTTIKTDIRQNNKTMTPTLTLHLTAAQMAELVVEKGEQPNNIFKIIIEEGARMKCPKCKKECHQVSLVYLTCEYCKKKITRYIM